MDETGTTAGVRQRYELRELIGAGGSGSVYRAWDVQLHRYVAFKRLHIEGATLDSESERLWREAMTLASMQHPNILTIHDSGVDDNGPYVVTEFIEGKTIEEIVSKEGTYHLKDFEAAVAQTLEALIAAHHTGLVHRDLKPQNIMVTHLASGAVQYKILDFGLAKFLSKPAMQTMDRNRGITGTLYFLAPEQFSQHPVDGRTDLYAMGCVYYYMLSGEYAFRGESIAEVLTNHMKHNVKDLFEIRHDLDHVLCDWVMGFMEVHPDDRPASAEEALARFRALPSHGTGRKRVITVPHAEDAPDTGHISVADRALHRSKQDHKTEKVTPEAKEADAKPQPKKKSSAGKWVSVVSLSLLVAITAIVALVKKGRQPEKKTEVTAKVFKVAPASKAVKKPVVRKAEKSAPEKKKESVAKPKEVAPAEKKTEETGTYRDRIGQSVAVDGEIVKIKRSKRTSSVSLIVRTASGEEVTLVVFVNDTEREWVDDNLKANKGQVVKAQGKLSLKKDVVQMHVNDIGLVHFEL